MATQFLSPSVTIEEISSTVQTTQSVSASTAAFAGFTTQGPVGEAKLVTSFDEYTRVFGDFSTNSYMTHEVAAYFSNGGRRAYILRIIPEDAVSSSASIQSKTTNQVLSTGDGAATTYSATAGASVLKDNGGTTHIVPDSLSIIYRAARAALTAQIARKRDGSTQLEGVTSQLNYEGRIDDHATLLSTGGTGKVYYRSVETDVTDITVTHVVSGNNTPLSVAVVGSDITVNLATDGGGLATSTAANVVTALTASAPASALVTFFAHTAGTMDAMAQTSLKCAPVYSDGLHRLIGGTLTIGWTSGAASKTISFAGVTTAPTQTKTNVAGSTALIDLRSGIFSLTTDATEEPDNATDFTLAYTPTSTTVTLSDDDATSVDSDGLMPITGSTLTSGGGIANDCYVNVVDGSWSLDFTAGATNIPHNLGSLFVTYKINAWALSPVAGGIWGDNLRVQIQGSVENFTASTASYSTHNVFILLKDRDGNYQLKETYEDLDFTDSTDSLYFPDTVSDLSELIDVSVLGANEAPLQLHGVIHTQIIAGGDELAAGQAITVTLGSPVVAKRTVTITYTDTASATKTITDDGSGNLTGDVDSSYATVVGGVDPNTIDYETGEINVKTTSVINGATLVTCTYYTEAEETAHVEDFGDLDLQYSYTVDSVLYEFYISGDDGTFDDTNYGRDQFTLPALREEFEGIYALDRVEEILQVCVPDFAGDVTITRDLLDYADLRAAEPQGGDRFIILTTPAGYTAQQAADWFRFNLLQSSNFAAIYWPWIKVKDPLANNRPLTVPPLGHVAGVFARTDANKNAGKAPGGTIDGQLNYLIGLESIPTQTDRDTVYQNRINPFISTDLNGTAVWGVRTISADSRWKLINARRVFMFVEKSVFSLTQWAIFENNGPALWAKLKAQLTGFLTELYNQGYFAGSTPSEAFKVVIDTSNNDQSTIDAGQLFIDISLRPFKSVEFIVARFQVLQTV